MISDPELKLYRVLFHSYSKNRVMPSWEALEARLGISRATLQERLQKLQEAGHILWDDPSSTASITMQKDPFIKAGTASSAHTGAAYFQQH